MRKCVSERVTERERERERESAICTRVSIEPVCLPVSDVAETEP